MAGNPSDKYSTLGAFRKATADMPDDTVLSLNQVGNLRLSRPANLDADDIQSIREKKPEGWHWYTVGQMVPDEYVGYYDMLFDEVRLSGQE